MFETQYAEDLESGFTSDIESKYKKMYEDDINPFAAFSKKVVELAQCLGELVILVAFTSAFCNQNVKLSCSCFTSS